MDFLKPASWSLETLQPPWASEISTYVFIRDNPASEDLPITARPRKNNEILWSSGALDGVFGHHMGALQSEEIAKQVQDLFAAVKNLALRSTAANLKSLYNTAIGSTILPLADHLQSRLLKELVPKHKLNLADVGRYFALGADRIEATKLGVLILAVAGKQSDIPVLETLALNDEFTLFAALAIARLVNDPEQSLWRMAKRVRGWGRIHLVERLNGTSHAGIQAWMLREGFRNEVRNEYLAGICAQTGKLHQALGAPEIDQPLLDGTAGILRALIAGGPSIDIDDYEFAPAVVRSYAGHALKADDLSLEHLLCAVEVLKFLSDDASSDTRLAKGWTGELRNALRAQFQQILDREAWRTKIASGLRSENPVEFYAADSSAAALNIDTRDIHFANVRVAPITSGSWYRLLQQTNERQMDEVVTFALSVLPLEKIATGPADLLGLGPGFEAHRTLDWLLQDLKRFPGYGWQLIETGLRSPVIRNRNLALTALSAWPRETWPAEALGLLRRAARDEPTPPLRKRLEETLRSN